jgi:hypothetical protein
MDPNTLAFLAADTLSKLGPYWPLIATKAAEKVGELLPDTVGKLWTALKDRMDVKEAAREALEDMLKEPDNQAFQTVLKVQLEKILKQDEAFAGNLQSLLADIQPQTNQQATVRGDKNTVIQGSHNQVLGKGSVQVTGDVKGDIVTGKKKK